MKSYLPTSIWGTQQIQFHSKPLYDGVFGIWYGKGHGVDRSGDTLHHGNLLGPIHLGVLFANGR